MMLRAIIYGLGDNFIRNYKWIFETFDVVALADGNKILQGECICGFCVVGIEGIQTIDFDVIVVTPTECHEIQKELICAGISNKEIILMKDLLHLNNYNSYLNVCFIIAGELRDILPAINYVYYFSERFRTGDICITLEVDETCNEILKVVDYKFIDKVLLSNCKDENKYVYDLCIELYLYPRIISSENEKIAAINPELIEYILLCEKFAIFNSRFFDDNYLSKGCSALMGSICNRKKMQQIDIYGYFNMDEDFHSSFEFAIEPEKLSENMKHPYILIGKKLNSMMSSEREFEEFTHIISIELDDYDVVVMDDSCDMEKRILLLKNAELLIDIDGDDVDLRHAIKGGCSIVLFGPTSELFYGHNENINIRKTSCLFPCEDIIEGWDSNCAAGNWPPDCLKTISAGELVDYVERALIYA